MMVVNAYMGKLGRFLYRFTLYSLAVVSFLRKIRVSTESEARRKLL